MTAIDAVILKPGDGERIGSGAAGATILATAESTGGGFTLSETTIPPGFPGPPAHTHVRMTDAFYVLEGTLTVRVAGDDVNLGAGGFVAIPPGTVHTFSNRSSAPARFLNINSPGGWERYLREIADLMRDGPPDPEQWRDVMSRYDFVPAGQPSG